MTTETKKAGRKPRSARQTVVNGATKSPQMPADGSWPKSVCDYLRKLRVGYEKNTNKLVTLVNERKSIEKEIEDIGESKPKRSEELKAHHFDVQRDLSNVRAQVRWYCDKIVESIADADQGELFEGARTKPTEDELLFKSSKNAWKEQLIESASGLEDRVISAIKNVGIATFGELAKYNEPMERVQGLTMGDLSAVQSALEKAQRGGKEPMGDDDEE